MQINDKRAIDIIIPVYNALTDLQKCINSLKRHTDITLHRVIMINDCSPDENILPYLKSIETENFILLNNDENMGFSATINKGIQYSDRDVILLNTDTIVTKDWVEKMIACAYSDESIGTVTPFSNNATLCSIPNFCQENVLPEGYTIDSYAAIIERCSLNKYPRITVAVGFCMYIKRCVVDDIGYFDAETFGKGYGEENDFCNRAEQVGYKHVLCDNTYIYHSGTASFVSQDKIELMRAHEKILDARYPKQMRNNHLYCMNNPDQYLRDNVDIYTRLGNKKNILYVLHMDIENTIGGTQQHVKDLVEHLRDNNNIFVVTPDGHSLRVAVYLKHEVLYLKYYVEKQEYFAFFNASHSAVFENIYKAFQIDLVHIHHFKGLGFDCVYEAKKLGIPVIFTAHDYYTVCPNIFLVNNENQYCLPQRNEQICATCLRKNLNYAETVSSNFLTKWEREVENIFDYCYKIIVPSNSTKNILESVYPNITEKTFVISHGIDVVEEQFCDRVNNEGFKCNLEESIDESGRFFGWAYLEGVDSKYTDIYIIVEDENNVEQIVCCEKFDRGDLAEIDSKYLNSGFILQNIDIKMVGSIKVSLMLKYKNDCFVKKCKDIYLTEQTQRRRPLNIAFVGGLSEIKGANEAHKIIKQFKEHNIMWHIFGDIGLSDLYEYSQSNLIKHGRYNRNNIAMLLKQYEIDVVCIFSICPETYCYTLSEVIMEKLPVIVTNIGALGERVSNTNIGWCIDVDSLLETVPKIIKEIEADREKLLEKKAYVEKMQLISVKEMLANYICLYNNFEKKSINEKYDTKMTFNACLNALPNNNGAYDNVIVKQLENELKTIKQSTSYKILNELSMMKIPFRKQVKKIMVFLYKKIIRRFFF